MLCCLWGTPDGSNKHKAIYIDCGISLFTVKKPIRNRTEMATKKQQLLTSHSPQQVKGQCITFQVARMLHNPGYTRWKQ